MVRNLVCDPNGNVAKNTGKNNLRLGEKTMVKMFGNISFRHSSRNRKLDTLWNCVQNRGKRFEQPTAGEMRRNTAVCINQFVLRH